jgi:hypothetical protein
MSLLTYDEWNLKKRGKSEAVDCSKYCEDDVVGREAGYDGETD